MDNTFICLLPSKKDAACLNKSLGKFFSVPFHHTIKLPLHVTLYFIPKPTNKASSVLSKWLKNKTDQFNGPMIAKLGKIGCFTNEGREYVYYLPLLTKRINRLHNELFEIFKIFYKDPFLFKPHLSLFYPSKNLEKKDKKEMENIFENFKNVTLDRIAIGTTKNKKIELLAIQKL